MTTLRLPAMMNSAVARLREQLDAAQRQARPAWGLVSSGSAPLDAMLPAGGFQRGTLVEWLAPEFGSGTTTLALRAARAAVADGRPLVVVERRGRFFPPSLPEDFPRALLLLVRCERDDELAWACDQALRTSGVGAVLTWFAHGDERRLRAWQLAAERSGALGIVVRHLPRQPEACFSDVRLSVQPVSAAGGRRVQLEVLRTRQGRAGARAEVSLDDDSHPLPQTAAATRPTRRAAGS